VTLIIQVILEMCKFVKSFDKLNDDVFVVQLHVTLNLVLVVQLCDKLDNYVSCQSVAKLVDKMLYSRHVKLLYMGCVAMLDVLSKPCQVVLHGQYLNGLRQDVMFKSCLQSYYIQLCLNVVFKTFLRNVRHGLGLIVSKEDAMFKSYLQSYCK
jgi:hypothetical protein